MPDPADLPSDKRLAPQRIVGTRGPLEKELTARGLIPPNCRLLEVVMGVDAALIVRYEVMVNTEDLLKFSEAFQAAAQQIAGPA